MSYSNENVDIIIDGNGVDDRFGINFYYIEGKPQVIVAELWDFTDPNSPQKLTFDLGPDYTIDESEYPNTEVVTAVPVPTDHKLVIYRDNDAIQTSSFSQGSFPAESVEETSDSVMMVAQENKEKLTRVLINNRVGPQISMEEIFQAIEDIEFNANSIALLGGGAALTVDSITDISIVGANNGDVLTYNSGTGEWENQPASASGISDAPIDTQEYVRKDGAWVVNTDEGISDAPIDTQEYVRKDGAWVVNSGGGGGEANTASNITGAPGIGFFKQKTGVDLEFKKLAPVNNPATSQAAVIIADAADHLQIYIDDSKLRTSAITNDAGYIPDAPADTQEYVRKDNAWAVSSGGGGGISDAPADGQDYVRNNNNWQVASYGSGSEAPSGTCTVWAGPEASIPAGWLLADGSGFDPAVYPNLYAAVGDIYKSISRDFLSGQTTLSFAGGANVQPVQGIDCTPDGSLMAWVEAPGAQNAVTPNYDIWIVVAHADTISGKLTTVAQLTAPGVNNIGNHANISMTSQPPVPNGFGGFKPATGHRIAVGFPFEPVGGNSNVGMVVVYEYDGASYNIIFTQYGPRSVSSEYFGMNVAISGDGNNLVVSTGILEQRWYHLAWNGGTLTYDTLLTQNTASNWYGVEVAMSEDGTRIAVGDQTNHKIEIWDIISPATTYQKQYDVGNGGSISLTGFNANESIGYVNNIGISADGSRMVFNGVTTGEVWVVDLNTQTELAYGSIGAIDSGIDYDAGDDLTVTMQGDGTHIIVGNPEADTLNGLQSGYVARYEITSGTYLKDTDFLVNNGAIGSGNNLGMTASATSDDGKIMFAAAPNYSTASASGLIISQTDPPGVPDINAPAGVTASKYIIKT